MAHFAEIGLNNIVQQVIVVNNNELLDENGIEQESKGQEFCRKLLGGTWLQTSYSGAFRKNFAGIGFVYDSVRDAFISPNPYPSWTLDETTLQWTAPVPDTDNAYAWDESAQSWTLIPLQG